MTGSGVADKFVKADSDRLAEVHGALLLAGGDAQEPVAVAQVFVREAALFRAKDKRHAVGLQPFADDWRAEFKAFDGVLRFAAAESGGANDERAVRDGFDDGREFFSRS